MNSQFKPERTKPVVCIELMIAEQEDKVFYRYNYGQDLSSTFIHEAWITEDQEGEHYFFDELSKVHYLKDFK